jgi:hypothetical protein
MQPLPFEAQLSPTYAILGTDLDNDGREDIVLGGNQYMAKPQTGIYAGTFGTVMLNKGEGVFEACQLGKSGFYVNGQVRDIKKLNFQGSEYLIVARNNDSPEIFGINK